MIFFAMWRLTGIFEGEEAPKLQQPRRVGHRLARQVDAHEVPQRLAVVEGIFERVVGLAVPLLKQVHAQHLRHAHRLVADTTTGRVQRLDHCDHPR